MRHVFVTVLLVSLLFEITGCDPFIEKRVQDAKVLSLRVGSSWVYAPNAKEDLSFVEATERWDKYRYRSLERFIFFTVDKQNKIIAIWTQQ